MLFSAPTNISRLRYHSQLYNTTDKKYYKKLFRCFLVTGTNKNRHSVAQLSVLKQNAENNKQNCTWKCFRLVRYKQSKVLLDMSLCTLFQHKQQHYFLTWKEETKNSHTCCRISLFFCLHESLKANLFLMFLKQVNQQINQGIKMQQFYIDRCKKTAIDVKTLHSDA